MEQNNSEPPLLIFRLEAKIAPTVWRPVEEVYPELSGKLYRFANRTEAATAKGQLKNYLRMHRPKAKAPIRISEVTLVACTTKSPDSL
jgi:hypothetical protein